ncbi:hypothetical protein Bca4012_051538 [Brassica carinata]
MEPNTMTSFDDRHRHSSFSSKICRICSYEVKDGDNGQTFVACHVCAFPVCKPCYEYERRNGENCCPQCNTPYKPNKGDEEEENNGPVDSDGELDIKNRKDASSIHQNFAYGSVTKKKKSKQQRRQNGRAFSSTGSVLGKTIDDGSNFLSGRHRRRKNFEKRFGMSHVFISSTLMEKRGLPEATNTSSLIKEAIYVISCGYEEKTEWGKEIRWI